MTSQLFYLILLLASLIAVAIWFWAFFFNPGDFIGLRADTRSETEFSRVALIKLHHLLNRLQQRRLFFLSIQEPGFPFGEAMDMGTVVADIGNTLLDEDLQVERYSGWILSRTGSHLRNVRVSSAGLPTLSIQMLDLLIDFVSDLISAIEKRNVVECHTALNKMLFLSATGHQPYVVSTNRLQTFRESCAQGLLQLTEDLFEKKIYDSLLQFFESWSGPTVQNGDAEIYSFLEIVQLYKDRFYSYSPKLINEVGNLLDNEIKKMLSAYARALLDKNELTAYKASAKLVTRLLRNRSKSPSPASFSLPLSSIKPVVTSEAGEFQAAS